MSRQSPTTAGAATSTCENHVTSSKRDFEKCFQCRHDGKKCLWRQPLRRGDKCKRCYQMGKECGARERAPLTRVRPDPYEAENIRACLRLLSDCRHDCQQLRFGLYPWPCSGLYSHFPYSWSKSFALRDDDNLATFISWLDLQIQALDELERAVVCHTQPWSARCPSSAQRALSACVASIFPGGPRMSMNQEGHIATGGRASAESYRLLAGLVQTLLQAQLPYVGNILTSGNRPLLLIENAFPPSHIAYKNGDTAVAIELWRQDTVARAQTTDAQSDPVLDLLGRTFQQLVAESGDFQTLKKIQARAGPSILYATSWSSNMSNRSWLTGGSPVTSNEWDVHANLDARGLSLFALAICSQGPADLESLKWLMPQRLLPPTYRLGPEPSLLDLAMLSGKVEIVRELVSRNMMTEAYSRYAEKAIELGRADMAFCFMDWLTEAARTNQQEVARLTCVAEQKFCQLQQHYQSATMANSWLANDIGRWLPPFQMLVQRLRSLVVVQSTLQAMLVDASRPMFE